MMILQLVKLHFTLLYTELGSVKLVITSSKEVMFLSLCI